MQSSLGLNSDPPPRPPAEPELKLVVDLPPRGKVFFGNLKDLLLRRESPRAWTTSVPAPFWRDVFVATGVPWAGLRNSLLVHAFVLLAGWLVGTAWMPMLQRHRNPELVVHDKIAYYSVSEYLPPLNTGEQAPETTRIERKGEPAYAKQQIVSLPPRPDNFEQTLITPPDVKLPTNIPLPNVMAWKPMPMAVPTAVARRSQIPGLVVPSDVIQPPPEPLRQEVSQLRTPESPREVVDAPPAIDRLDRSRRALNVPAPQVIEPPPTPEADLRRQTLDAPPPAVIEPPPSAEVARRRVGEMNLARFGPQAAAPALPVVEQRAANVPLLRPGAASARGASNPGQDTAAAPGAIGLPGGEGRQQLIALNLHPVDVRGPILVPPGRRSGEFAAGPEGKPGAPGTPDIRGTSGRDAGGSTPAPELPAGIVVGAAPNAPTAGTPVVAAPPKPSYQPAAPSSLRAALGPSRIEDLARATRPGTPPSPPAKVEEKVFQGKKYYSMTLNMPNLSSVGGSWIIRFAQLIDDHLRGELTSPVPTVKVDPAYPLALIQEHIEGTVVLYAVIHKDGSVADVKVLRGIHEKLDENARLALLHWHFRPGTKNGSPVDLEAVIKIPFVSKRDMF